MVYFPARSFQYHASASYLLYVADTIFVLELAVIAFSSEYICRTLFQPTSSQALNRSSTMRSGWTVSQ